MADCRNSGGAVSVNLTTGIGSGADVTGDVLVSIESIYGSNFLIHFFGIAAGIFFWDVMEMTS